MSVKVFKIKLSTVFKEMAARQSTNYFWTLFMSIGSCSLLILDLENHVTNRWGGFLHILYINYSFNLFVFIYLFVITILQKLLGRFGRSFWYHWLEKATTYIVMMYFYLYTYASNIPFYSYFHNTHFTVCLHTVMSVSEDAVLPVV